MAQFGKTIAPNFKGLGISIYPSTQLYHHVF